MNKIKDTKNDNQDVIESMKKVNKSSLFEINNCLYHPSAQHKIIIKFKQIKNPDNTQSEIVFTRPWYSIFHAPLILYVFFNLAYIQFIYQIQ